jgi:hypothetical protein
MEKLHSFSIGEQYHPFVRATATLCKRALDEISAMEHSDVDACIDHYVWDDEGVVVSRAPRDMDDEAVQLVGEMTVLLDMNEGRTADERKRFGSTHDLPYCMQSSRNRSEFFEGYSDDGRPPCELRYCPLRPPVDRLSAHREISRAFCHYQRRHASAKTAKRLWGSAVENDALRKFWRELESRAHF